MFRPEIQKVHREDFMKPIRIQQFARAIISMISLLVLASCGQQTPTVANPPDSSQLTTQAAVSGLTGTYYDLSNFTGPTLTRVDTTINFAWGTGAPLAGIQPTTYAVAWTGQIQAPTTEEYTFFVTSGGGARLMVNGQAVTNNWTDHAVTTDSGKIKLVTSQKVDVRLEYYRNTANPGTVKLEWSSATRARAVVPASALFSTVGNLDSVLTLIRTNTKFAAADVVFAPQASMVGLQANDKKFFFGTESDGKGFVMSVIHGTQIRGLLRVKIVGTTGTLTDYVRGYTTNIGDVSQKDAMVKKIASALSQGLYLDNTAVLTPLSTTLTSKGIATDAYCQLIPPPPICKDNVCADEAKAYQAAICGNAGLIEDVIITFVNPIVGTFAVGFDIVTKGKRYFEGGYNIYAALDDYLACLKKNALTDCKIQISVSPTPLIMNVGIGMTTNFNLEIKNLDVYQQNSSGVLPPQRAGGMLDFEVVVPPIPELRLGLGNPTGRIRPGSVQTANFVVFCPNTVKTVNTIIDVYSNADRPRVTVPVTINCKSVYLPNEVAFEMYACGGGAAIVSNGITVGSSHDYCFSTYSAYSGPGFNRSLYLLPSTNTADPYTLAKWTAVCTTAEFQFDKCRGADARQANTHVAEALSVWKSRLKPGLTYEVVKGSVSIANPYDYNTARIRVNISD
jgi:PA14 domain